MSSYFNHISSLSISAAVFIALIRFKKINASYYPFVICVCIGLINELVSFFITGPLRMSAVNNNINVLIESVLILWQFKNWNSFRKRTYLFWVIGSLFIAAWIAEVFFIRPITPYYTRGILEVASYFRILSSFILVLLAVNQINELIVLDRKNILLNPIFLICMGIVFYYTYKVWIETFWSYGLLRDLRMTKVWNIHDWINLFSNLIYAFAILWMQKRQRFLLPS